MASKHDQVAKRIAKARGGQYHPTQTPDVKTPAHAIEVKVKERALGKGIQQLQHYGGPKSKYLGVPPELVRKAIERSKGTGIGVMTAAGRIAKRARRHKKRR